MSSTCDTNDIEKISSSKAAGRVTKRSSIGKKAGASSSRSQNASEEPATPNEKKEVPSLIQTFVFLDFGTTSAFPHNRVPQRKRSGKEAESTELKNRLRAWIQATDEQDYPKIRDMSFTWVSRSQLEKGIRNMDKKFAKKLDSATTTLEEHNIERRVYTAQLEWRFKDGVAHEERDQLPKQPFLYEWPELCRFLKSCQKPACFVAHNGVDFDYRVLFGELRRNGFLDPSCPEAAIPEGVYFVDSLMAFKEIDRKHRIYLQKELAELSESTSEHSILHSVENEEGTHLRSPENSNDVTLPNSSNPRKNHPLSWIDQSKWSPAMRKRILENHFRRIPNGKWCLSHQKNSGYSLVYLFKAIFGRVYELPHYSQSDVTALLQVSIGYGLDFTKYCDHHKSVLPYLDVLNNAVTP